MAKPQITTHSWKMKTMGKVHFEWVTRKHDALFMHRQPPCCVLSVNWEGSCLFRQVMSCTECLGCGAVGSLSCALVFLVLTEFGDAWCNTQIMYRILYRALYVSPIMHMFELELLCSVVATDSKLHTCIDVYSHTAALYPLCIFLVDSRQSLSGQ